MNHVTISHASLRATLPASRVDPVCVTKPGVVDLCIYRGDSGRVRVTLTDTAGAPIDVSSATWDCDFRLSEDDTTVLCSPTVEAVVGVTNAVDVVITSACSAALNEDGRWDLQMNLAGESITVLAGRLYVTKDVSRP